MNTTVQNPTLLVSKEDIGRLSFSSIEVLSSDQEKVQRDNDLYKAMILGNSLHNKVKIVFQTEEEIRAVETTVWFATDNYVILKGGATIPVKCVRKVIL